MHLPRIDACLLPISVLVCYGEHVEHLRRGNRWVGLVDKPRDRPRACKIHFPAEDVDELAPLLKASADVLHGEGAVANDRHDLTRDVRVIEAHLHRIVHRTAELILALVVNWSGEDESPWEKGDGADLAHEWLPVGVPYAIVSVHLGLTAKLMVQGPSALMVPDIERHWLNVHLVVPVSIVDLADHVRALHVCAQPEVGSQAKFVDN
mmetsp:Transcript_108549/g.231830  ORF Transcript_108549/g.231830 Transcript_108549/m.231830 type:complete len:207 (-) Transcript_108549:555-1175(-)